MLACLGGKKLLDVDLDGATTFYWAGRNNDFTCTKVLFEEAERQQIQMELINKVTYEGHSPLYTAALNGHATIMSFLLNNGATVDSKTNDEDRAPGSTPLIAACSKGQAAAVEILLQHNTDLYHQNKADVDCA